MFRNILPNEYFFFDYFENHNDLTIKLAEEMVLVLKEPTDLVEGAKRIKKLESELDQIETTCIEALHKTFITPIERTEIYKLIQRMDSIANALHSSLSRINLYEISVIRPEAVELVNVVVECCKEIGDALRLLRDMKNIEKIKEHCKRTRKLESEGDKIFKAAIKSLFQEKDPILIIKWKEIFDKIEKGLDRCQDVANIIEEIVIENA